MKQQRSFSQTLAIYVIGFAGALLLSVASYIIVVKQSFGQDASLTMAVLLGLAVIQLVIQLVCFLHLKPDKNPFSRTGSILMAIGTALIIIVGSIWIMRNLDYRMGMSPEAMQDYMIEQNKKGF